MDPDDILTAARSALSLYSARTAELLLSLSDSAARIPGATWTVREAAVHLVNFGHLLTDIAVGVPSPRMTLDREAVAVDNDRRIADVPETDPGKLARLVTEALDRFLDVTADRPGDQGVTFHCGLQINLAGLAGVALGEVVLHGYDMATAVGFPWPIDPIHAQLILAGYGPCFGEVVNHERAHGLSAGFGIELRGGPSFTVRFTEGEYSVEPPGSGPVDCTISYDPVAFLMVGSGRLSPWAAGALGLMTTSGDRAELGLRFSELFLYP
jgi:uncharacterized protein (TIGR03083 family)